MKRLLASAAIVAMGALATMPAASAAPPADPCDLLTKKEVKGLLLGKKVVKVQRKSQGDIAECTWRTKFFQTPKFKSAKAAFSLKLSVQPLDTAQDSLDQLRSRSTDFEDHVVDKVDGIGEEAYRYFADLIVVQGDVAMQVGVSNYDTSKPPEPDVDTIADDAAKLALDRLDA
jgi:hypothetical protein